MKYRALGNTGIAVSAIGFGTWGLGGTSYGPVDDMESLRALRLAFAKGVNFFDTADLYGNGHSEEVLGRGLSDVRDKVVIATKVGLLPHSGFHMPMDLSEQHIRRGLESSLRRLRSDFVDLYQLHSPDLEMLESSSAIATLEALRNEGKIRAIGLSARTPADALAAIRRFPIQVVQVNYNLIDHRAADCGLLEEAAERGIGVIARTPLCFGYLTGRLDGSKERLVAGDHRSNWPEDQLHRWATSPEFFEHLCEADETVTQFALRFCLSHSAISTTIPGMMTVAEVEEDVAVGDRLPLSPACMREIRAVYDRLVFFDSSAKQRGRQ